MVAVVVIVDTDSSVVGVVSAKVVNRDDAISVGHAYVKVLTRH
ncbi:hypothetical protein M8C21_021491, partial [Ambrosia artemisiifolia]